MAQKNVTAISANSVLKMADLFFFLNRRWGVLTLNPPTPCVRYCLYAIKGNSYLFIYYFTATEMTKMRFKRHIIKVNLPLLLHHNQSISRLNKKVGWNRRNVGNFCKLERRANKKRIILKKISFRRISYRQGGGTPTPPFAYVTVKRCTE